MLACILAGGEGTRLRPLTAYTPKPMVELAGRPVLGHMLNRLSACGVDRAAITLMYLPDAVREGIGSGAEYGMKINYRVEETPLGTAGAVKACADLVGSDEDFLVVSGDAVTGFDFGKAVEFHRGSRADATIVLTHSAEPTEYGLVRVAADGRVLGFAEKPAWENVFTDLVNTGIYVLSRKVLERIPAGKKFDFSGELFPSMLSSGKLFGFEAEGYWCDIGNPEAYLRCSMDFLEGRTGIFPEEPEVRPGIWIAKTAKVDAGAKLVAPVMVCRGASVASGSVLGPGVVVGPGAAVESGASAVGSVISGVLGEGCEAEDAVICRGGRAGACSVLRRHSIVGPGADTGRHSFLAAGAVLSENERLGDGAVRKSGQPHAEHRVCFEDGAISASAALCFDIGAAVAGESAGMRVLVGCAQKDAEAATEAEAAAAGLMYGGAEVIRHDAGFAAGAAELARLLCADRSVFVSGGKLRIYGPDGLPISAREQKKLAAAILRGAAGGKNGVQRFISGAKEFCAASCAKLAGERRERRLRVCVSGEGASSDTLRLALRLAGFDESRDEDALMVGITSDGFGVRLRGKTEFNKEQTAGMAILAAAEASPGRRIAIPADAPAAFGLAVNRRGSAALRVGRDRDAALLASKQRIGFCGLATAVSLISFLDTSGKTPEALSSELPDYAVRTVELGCETPRAELMRKLVGSFPEGGSDGVTVSTVRGSATLRPCELREAIRITAEAADAETARSIAEDIVKLAKKLDLKS